MLNKIKLNKLYQWFDANYIIGHKYQRKCLTHGGAVTVRGMMVETKVRLWFMNIILLAKIFFVIYWWPFLPKWTSQNGIPDKATRDKEWDVTLCAKWIITVSGLLFVRLKMFSAEREWIQTKCDCFIVFHIKTTNFAVWGPRVQCNDNKIRINKPVTQSFPWRNSR